MIKRIKGLKDTRIQIKAIRKILPILLIKVRTKE